MLWRSLMEDRSRQDTTQQISSIGRQQHQPCLLAVSHCMQGKHHRAQQPSGREKRKTSIWLYNCEIVPVISLSSTWFQQKSHQFHTFRDTSLTGHNLSYSNCVWGVFAAALYDYCSKHTNNWFTWAYQHLYHRPCLIWTLMQWQSQGNV